jgi:hypothetical protein
VVSSTPEEQLVRIGVIAEIGRAERRSLICTLRDVDERDIQLKKIT